MMWWLRMSRDELEEMWAIEAAEAESRYWEECWRRDEEAEYCAEMERAFCEELEKSAAARVKP